MREPHNVREYRRRFMAPEAPEPEKPETYGLLRDRDGKLWRYQCDSRTLEGAMIYQGRDGDTLVLFSDDLAEMVERGIFKI